MSLQNLFKKKQEEKTENKKVTEDKTGKKPADLKAEKNPLPLKIAKKEIAVGAYKILKSPHISERAVDLQNSNQYTFKVSSGKNKKQIKEAVEAVYGVNVDRVNIVNVPRKRKNFRRVEGWKGGYKKAIVKIKAGAKIEILPH